MNCNWIYAASFKLYSIIASTSCKEIDWWAWNNFDVFFLLSLTMRISFYSYDTIIQYPHYLYSAGWNGLKWIITKRNIGMRLAQIFPPYILRSYEYMLNVEWRKQKRKNRYDVHYIQCTYTYIFFIHWMEFLIGYASCQFSQKPFSISTYSFSYIYWILTFIP